MVNNDGKVDNLTFWVDTRSTSWAHENFSEVSVLLNLDKISYLRVNGVVSWLYKEKQISRRRSCDVALRICQALKLSLRQRVKRMRSSRAVNGFLVTFVTGPFN